MTASIRILLADDHAVVREGMRALLEDFDEISVVGEAQNGDQALELLARVAPDLLMTDVKMPGIAAADLVKQATALLPAMRILVFTSFAEGRLVRALLDAGLAPFLCVGELLAQREKGETEAVVTRQLQAACKGLPPVQLKQMVIAYEPVWAIGTGRNATPEDAAQVHRTIRATLESMGAGEVPILYGGSVNKGNVQSLIARPEIQGVLVGGASLDPEGWAEVVQLARSV